MNESGNLALVITLETQPPDERGCVRAVGWQRSEVRIGRAPQMEMRITPPGISLYHARVWVERDRARIRDMGTISGTFVNRRRALGEVVLNHGDEIEICGAHVTVALSHEVVPNYEAHREDDAAVEFVNGDDVLTEPVEVLDSGAFAPC